MVIENKATKYLYCFYANYSQEFINAYNRLYNLGVIVGLTIGDKTEDYLSVYDEHIFVIFDISKVKQFEDYLLFFSIQEAYEIDYSIDDKFHVVVFKVARPFKNTLNNFKKGRYSRMYSSKDLEFLFSKTKGFCARFDNLILTKDNCNKVRNLSDNFSKLKLSPYHVLKRSDKLKEVLEKLYEANIDDDTELDALPDDREYLTQSYQNVIA